MNINRRILWLTDNIAQALDFLAPLDALGYLVVPSTRMGDVKIELVKLGAVAAVLHFTHSPEQLRQILQLLQSHGNTPLPISVLLPLPDQKLRLNADDACVQWFDGAVLPFDFAAAVHRHIVLNQ